MIAMEAATPFQIFTCINLLKKYQNREVDLFLYTYATNLDSIAKRLRKEKLFREIYIIDSIPQKNRFSLIKYMLFSKKMLPKIEIEKYETLYISYSGVPNLLLYNLLRKKNKNINLYFYEDGVTSYYKGIFEHSINVKRLCYLLRKQIDSEKISKVLLYEPKLSSVQYKNNIILDKLLVTNSKVNIDLIKNIFSISKNAETLIKEANIIYFDHDFRKYITKDIFINFDQNIIVNNIANQLNQKIIVKVSPLSKNESSKYKGNLITVSNFDKAPWEILIYDDKNIDKKCLISVCSNAVITPKTVYGKEPYVLILGKALFLSEYTNSTDVWTKEMEQFYNRVKGLYYDKKKFMIPETLDEALEMLKTVLKR